MSISTQPSKERKLLMTPEAKKRRLEYKKSTQNANTVAKRKVYAKKYRQKNQAALKTKAKATTQKRKVTTLHYVKVKKSIRT